MKHKFLKLSLLTLMVVCGAAAFFLFNPAETKADHSANHADATAQMSQENIVLKKADGEELIFNVELAITGAEQSQGLMNRKSLGEYSGMLFIFATERQRSFWMKNTLIPLDMLFLDKNGVVQHIHHRAKPLDETMVTSQEPAMAVLEINGGLSDRLNINAGDKVYHNAFRNMNLLAE